MSWNVIFMFLALSILEAYAVRLHKLFQYLDGYKSDYKLRGFLHLGYDYAVFLRLPKTHDKYLIYELYEAKKIADIDHTARPRILAIAKVPIEYIKEQLKTYRGELYKAKYIDENVVPGTRVKTLREWQIDRAMSYKDESRVILKDNPNILRSIV